MPFGKKLFLTTSMRTKIWTITGLLVLNKLLFYVSAKMCFEVSSIGELFQTIHKGTTKYKRSLFSQFVIFAYLDLIITYIKRSI